jgi:hypothetical protein
VLFFTKFATSVLADTTAAANQQNADVGAMGATLYLKLSQRIHCETTGIFFPSVAAAQKPPTILPKGFCRTFQQTFDAEIAADRAILQHAETTNTRPLEEFSQALQRLCARLTNAVVKGKRAEGCIFGLPSTQQPLFAALMRLRLMNKLPEAHSDGSWCYRPEGPKYGDQRDNTLALVFNAANGTSDWAHVQAEMKKEGFSKWIDKSDPVIAPLVVPLQLQDSGGFALPFPAFSIYHGIERGNQLPRPCKASASDCPAVSRPGPPTSEGICVTTAIFGP